MHVSFREGEENIFKIMRIFDGSKPPGGHQSTHGDGNALRAQDQAGVAWGLQQSSRGGEDMDE